MTNMQLAFSEFIENARHHRADESNTARDIEEKIRHNQQSEQLTQAQNDLQKYLGELNARMKQKEILTNAEVNKLRIATDKAIADAKQNLSEREYETTKSKVAAEIKKLEANTAESLTNAANTQNLTDAQKQKFYAEANYRNAKGLGSVGGLIGIIVGKAMALDESSAGQAVGKAKTDAAVTAAKTYSKAKNAVKEAVSQTVKKEVENKKKQLGFSK